MTISRLQAKTKITSILRNQYRKCRFIPLSIDHVCLELFDLRKMKHALKFKMFTQKIKSSFARETHTHGSFNKTEKICDHHIIFSFNFK